jgi:hypothetical protein
LNQLEQPFANGRGLRQQQRVDSSLPVLRELASTMPASAEVRLELAQSLILREDFAGALEAAEDAVDLAPDSAEALSLLGALLLEMGQAERAVAPLTRVTELLPRWAEGWRLCGEAAYRLGRPQDAVEYLQRALLIQPNWPEAMFRLGECHLKLGNYLEGWRLYESRWECAGYDNTSHRSRVPRWQGREDLQGKSILIQAEQGMGDMIQFVRFARLLEAQGAQVIVACAGTLAALVASVPGVHGVAPFGTPLPRVDYTIPLLSLPFVLRMTLGAIPTNVPYMHVNRDITETWRRRIEELAPGGNRRVGLVWSGHSQHVFNRYRSVPFAAIQQLLEIPGNTFFSLQKGGAANVLRHQKTPVINLAPDLQTFEHTAAAIRAMDLVITVDTAVAHLAGALGARTNLLLHAGCDFRWMTVGDRTPWYPTLQLYRQDRDGDWQPPLERIALHLQMPR